MSESVDNHDTKSRTPDAQPRVNADRPLGRLDAAPQPLGMGSWFCLECDASNQSVKFDLEARKHTETTGHPTSTSHRDPVPLSQCLEEVRADLTALKRKRGSA